MVTIARQTNGPNWSNILTDSVVIDPCALERTVFSQLFFFVFFFDES